MSKQRLLLDRLAERLYLKMEHLDPEPPGDPNVREWLRLTDDERGYFHTLVENLLLDREAVLGYFGLEAAPGDGPAAGGRP